MPGNAGKGRARGVPNKVTADVKAMMRAALTKAGGVKYLVNQAHANPRAFMSLIGRLMPLEVTGADGKDLIPAPAETDPTKIALLLLNVLRPAGAAPEGENAEPGTPTP